MFSNVIAAGAAIGLAVAPLAAAAAPLARTATPVEGEGLVGSGATALAVGGIVAALLVGILIISDDGDDEPVSP